MNTRSSALVRVVALGVCTAVSGADWVEQRTAHDRPGIYNGGFVVRVLDHDGLPVPASVSVSDASTTTRSSPVSTRTDANGRAELHGVFARHVYVDVGGADDLRPYCQRVEGVSNGVVDLGLVSIERNFGVTGVLLQKDIDGVLKPRADSVTVQLWRRRGGTYDNVGARDWDRREGVFRMDDFDIEPNLFLVISWPSEQQRKSIIHRVPFTADPLRPRRHLLVTLPREDADDQAVDVQEGVWPDGVPATAKRSPLRFAGRLVTSGGRPLAGLPVLGAGTTVYTDEDGRVELESPDMIRNLTVPTPSGALFISSRPVFGGVDPLPPRSVVDFDRPFEADFETLRRLRLVARGEREDRIDYQWLDSYEWSDYWRPTTVDLLRTVLGRSDERTLIRARAPGRIDRFVTYPPKNLSVVFDFGNDEPHGIVVVDEGKPVAGAKVDILDVATPLTLRTLRLRRGDPRAPIVLKQRDVTDSEGRLSLAGDPDGLYVAYVYAQGYEPAWVRLSAGVDKRVELRARDVDVRFRGLLAGGSLRVKVAGSDALAAVVRGVDDEPVVARLAPGTYDATVSGPDGGIVSGTTFAIADAPDVVDLHEDRRPQVVIHLPEGLEPRGWFVGASRHPHGDWRDYGDGEVRLQVESVGGATRVLRLPGTGRWNVHAGRSRTQSYFAEVNVGAGEIRELRLTLDASLEGTMTYEPDLDDDVIAYHWVDGPRLMLVATGGPGAGWNVMYSLPRPDGEGGRKPHTFALAGVPAGDYRLFHHLADRQARGGGRDVTLAAGSTTRLEGLGSHRPGRLVVEVVDTDGQPIRNRILRILDRMYKEWTAPDGRSRVDSCNEFVLVSSGGPVERIPSPPALRLDGAPVILDSIRPGWLELVVDDPAGDARHYLRKVEPGKTLRLIVES